MRQRGHPSTKLQTSPRNCPTATPPTPPTCSVAGCLLSSSVSSLAFSDFISTTMSFFISPDALQQRNSTQPMSRARARGQADRVTNQCGSNSHPSSVSITYTSFLSSFPQGNFPFFCRQYNKVTSRRSSSTHTTTATTTPAAPPCCLSAVAPEKEGKHGGRWVENGGLGGWGWIEPCFTTSILKR